MMSLSEYQKASRRTIPASLGAENHRLNAALGLAGESGEIVEIIKKMVFHGHDRDDARISEELGDVLFYVAYLATAFGLDLAVIAEENIGKLKRRYPAGFSEHDSRSRTE